MGRTSRIGRPVSWMSDEQKAARAARIYEFERIKAVVDRDIETRLTRAREAYFGGPDSMSPTLTVKPTRRAQMYEFEEQRLRMYAGYAFKNAYEEALRIIVLVFIACIIGIFVYPIRKSSTAHDPQYLCFAAVRCLILPTHLFTYR
jgi:hypothetical protein